MFATFHPDGRLPQSDAFIDVQPDNIVVSVLKQSEDNDDLIIRAYETINEATTAWIRLPHQDRMIEAVFGPSEIKTFRVPSQANLPVVETDLLEF